MVTALDLICVRRRSEGYSIRAAALQQVRGRFKEVIGCFVPAICTAQRLQLAAGRRRSDGREHKLRATHGAHAAGSREEQREDLKDCAENALLAQKGSFTCNIA